MPLKEASSAEAAQAFLHHWASIWGLPSLVTSDNGASFTANLWQDMMKNLNIEVKYSALYRPQAMGMLERQHRGLKDSLKAALIDMGETHQDKWLDVLPFVLLGRRVAFQPDMGASSSEMVFGKNVTIPGEILSDPDSIEGAEDYKNLLELVKANTDRRVSQPSRHSKPEGPLLGIAEDVSHVYTRQHQTTGLQSHFEGPFKIAERVSRSVFKLEVGSYKDGRKRYEFRHLNDLKAAHPKSLASPAERPKLGRPPTKTSVSDKAPDSTEAEPSSSTPDSKLSSKLSSKQNKQDGAVSLPSNDRENLNSVPSTGPPQVPAFTGRPSRSTRNPSPRYVDAIWAASEADLAYINQQINKKINPNRGL